MRVYVYVRTVDLAMFTRVGWGVGLQRRGASTGWGAGEVFVIATGARPAHMNGK